MLHMEQTCKLKNTKKMTGKAFLSEKMFHLQQCYGDWRKHPGGMPILR